MFAIPEPRLRQSFRLFGKCKQTTFSKKCITLFSVERNTVIQNPNINKWTDTATACTYEMLCHVRDVIEEKQIISENIFRSIGNGRCIFPFTSQNICR